MSLLSTLRNREAHKLHYTPPHTLKLTHTCTLTHTQTHTLIYTCTHTHTLSHILTLTCTCTHTHTYIHSHTHSHIHWHSYTHTLTYTHSHSHTHGKGPENTAIIPSTLTWNTLAACSVRTLLWISLFLCVTSFPLCFCGLRYASFQSSWLLLFIVTQGFFDITDLPNLWSREIMYLDLHNTRHVEHWFPYTLKYICVGEYFWV